MAETMTLTITIYKMENWSIDIFNQFSTIILSNKPWFVPAIARRLSLTDPFLNRLRPLHFPPPLKEFDPKSAEFKIHFSSNRSSLIRRFIRWKVDRLCVNTYRFQSTFAFALQRHKVLYELWTRSFCRVFVWRYRHHLNDVSMRTAIVLDVNLLPSARVMMWEQTEIVIARSGS